VNTFLLPTRFIIGIWDLGFVGFWNGDYVMVIVIVIVRQEKKQEL
jgi:hypothetical protein